MCSIKLGKITLTSVIEYDATIKNIIVQCWVPTAELKFMRHSKMIALLLLVHLEKICEKC